MVGSLRFENPDVVHVPLGPYSHTCVVSAGTDLIYLSGQIGIRPDGTVGSTISEQADQAFANVIALLRAHSVEMENVVKLTVFIVAGHDAEGVRKARVKHFGSHTPTSTTVYVAQLLKPEWFIEVEAIAAVSGQRARMRSADFPGKA
jgi:enamine deaminase RidA (YjgF/YER057c/UK114 family)